MKTIFCLTKRNIKLFFKDKGLFFTSLITPLILLLLYSTFLGNVYRDSFTSVLTNGGYQISEKLINGLVGGELISSLLAVSCVTVSFCSNMLMVQDKVSKAKNDLIISPVKPSVLALSYYIATLFSTLIVCIITACAGFLYLASIGWYLTVTDVLFMLLDVFLLVMFGTALSSIINFFLTSQGQISAVGTIVSSCYGFVCGAYMPISSFSEGLQKVISFLPGTYATVLLRRHTMGSAFLALEKEGVPTEVITGICDGVDYNLYFFDHRVSTPIMFAVLVGTVLLLVGVYILQNALASRKGAA